MMITPEQRDAVYDQLLDRLSGIGDVWIAASKERFDTADRLGREYSDDLRLVLDDLGWGGRPGQGPIELTAPTQVLRSVFGRLQESVEGERDHWGEDWAASREHEERNRIVGEACQAVLGELEGGRE